MSDKTIYDSDVAGHNDAPTLLDGDDISVVETCGGQSKAGSDGSRTLPDGGDPSVAADTRYEKGAGILGTYRVESDPIESGGMGLVWRVHHTGWNVDLAMKRPRAERFSSEQSKFDFIHECDTWIGLGLHPNIVSCYYVRLIDGIPAIFSEWMDGGDLAHAINSGSLYEGFREEPARVQERILDIAIQFARGLHYAHESKDEAGKCRDLIHRDVKPGNVLLTQDGEAKVADFGLAQARALLKADEPDAGNNGRFDASVHLMLSPSGGYTPAYCSAEQMEHKPLTLKTDIYSWAVSVLEMYVGGHTWANGSVVGMDCRWYFKQARVPIPEPVKDLLERCLAPEPENRPHHFGLIIAELRAIYQLETGSSYPREASQAAPDTADSLNNRALSMLDLGKTEEAEKLWERALLTEPNHVEARYNARLCAMRANGSREELERALREMEVLCEGLPSARGYYLLGMLKLESYNGGARLDFQRACELAGNEPDMLALCSRMRDNAARAFVSLPVQLSDSLAFDVSEDGERCAVVSDLNDAKAAGGERMQLQLFQMTSRKRIAQTRLDSIQNAYVRFENGTLYLADRTSGNVRAFDAHTLAPLSCGKTEIEVPREKRIVLYDGRRGLTQDKPTTVFRGNRSSVEMHGGGRFVDLESGKGLLSEQVYTPRSMDSRGNYLHIRFDYGPFNSNGELALYDMRLFGQPAEYALNRIRSTAAVIAHENKLSALMRTAQAAYAKGDDPAALAALDLAYDMMGRDPSEEWEHLNNLVGSFGRRVELRGWRTGNLRGKAERIRKAYLCANYGPYNLRVNSNSEIRLVRPDDGGKDCGLFLHAGVTKDCCALTPDGTRMATAGEDGMLRLWDVGEQACRNTIRFGEPVPPEDDYAALRPFFRFRAEQKPYCLRPERVLINADGTAALLAARVCNPYGEDDDESNAIKLMLYRTETGDCLYSACFALDWRDRDEAESNQAPFQGAVFSPDGYAMLIEKEMGGHLLCFHGLQSCSVQDLLDQSPGCFRGDGNSYPDDNAGREIILDWKYAANGPRSVEEIPAPFENDRAPDRDRYHALCVRAGKALDAGDIKQTLQCIEQGRKLPEYADDDRLFRINAEAGLRCRASALRGVYRHAGRNLKIGEGVSRKLCAIGEDGKTMLAVLSGNRVALIDAETGKIRDLDTGKDNCYFALKLALSRDGRFALGRHEIFGGLYRWDLASGAKQAAAEPVPHPSRTTAICPNSDGSLLFSGDERGSLSVWDMQSLTQTSCSSLFQSRVTALCILPDQNTLLCAGERGELALWDVHTQSILQELGQALPKTGMLTLAVSRDGRFAASAERDLTRLLFSERMDRMSAARKKQQPTVLKPDRYSLSGENQGGRLFLWDLKTGEPRWIGAYRKDGYGALCFTPDDRHLAAGYKDGLSLYASESGACLHEFSFEDSRECFAAGKDQNASLIAFSPDQATLTAAFSSEFHIKQFDLDWTFEDPKQA